MSIKKLNLAILLVGALALFQTGCSGTRVGDYSVESYNQNPLSVAIPEDVDTAGAIRAAESALVARRWVIIDKGDEHVTGKLRHRRFDATVNIKVEDRHLVIYSDSLYQDREKNEMTPAVPYGWLKYLQEDIQKSIPYQAYRSS
ncbi:MAG: hypothetical protein JSU95_14105 [Betaproteobacteria bacterium]|nr:MAG: hypothetical protein JSU95_14105 [Betaproteobacteria bacterium]